MATTSICSGLLRKSNFISVVLALNIKLCAVTLMGQDRVRTELTKPTFQKVGLNGYCRFIPKEELDRLLPKIEGLGGHIHPTFVDTIAMELDEES